MILRDGHDEVDATTGRTRRQEDHEALIGQVRRDERGGRPSAEVNLVEPETQAAVHLQVRAQHRLLAVRRRDQPLGLHLGGLGDIFDDGVDVLCVCRGWL